VKRALLVVLVFGVCLRFVTAGPEPIRDDKKVVVPIPEHREFCNWTGFYIGGNIGYAFEANADISMSLGGSWDVSGGADREVVTPFGNKNLNADGVVAGGFFGYNYQWNHFVLGVEATANYFDLHDSFNSGLLFVPLTGDSVGVRHSFETNFVGTVGPRFGYAFGRFLFDITGGVAIGDLRFSQEVVEPEFDFVQRGSADDVQLGWTAGAGFHYCLTEHWSVRADYRYTDLGCTDFSSVGNQTEFTGHHEACLTFHSITAGIAYKF
jgi:outer membrane immunogenic protein